MIEGGRATGVRLRNGHIIRAKKAVVSNASLWDTVKLISDEHVPTDLQKRNKEMPLNPSFMHLHVGFDATGASHCFSHFSMTDRSIPDLDVDLHHIIVNKWRPRVDCEQNVVLISIPSVVDPSFAPPGKHSLHAYLPATEPYDIWANIDPKR